ncbi:MAG: DNA repair protein RecN [Ignavibacteriales bacterium]|nr:DNA repair protein RecN [Ignavibacteriales bacterium]
MLRSLLIKNYALIEEISVEFSSGLTIITGETGAGKSILVDALGLLLGERASTEMIRSGAEKAIVEGLFVVKMNVRVADILRSNENDVTDEIIVRREVTNKGQSRCFINDSPVNVSMLKEIGDALVDLHGQHEHQSLLHPETHIDFLDDFGGYEKELETYRVSYRQLAELTSRKRELQEQEDQLKAKKSLFEFQIKEIDAVNPQAGEEEHLEAELKILENTEKLNELTGGIHQILYESESSTRDSLVKARKMLDQLAEIDATFADAVHELKSAEVIVDEISKQVQNYASRIEFNPDRLEVIRERLGALTMLKKKYGGTLDVLIAYRQKIGDEFKFAENFEGEIAKLEKEIESFRNDCGTKAGILTQRRKENSKKLEKEIIASLAELGIQKAKFETTINQRRVENNTNALAVKIGSSLYEATSDGVDHVEFFLSTNVGEDAKSLVKVASGGEVSRIMLALKSALAQSDKTPLLIFDEIDTGVSGRIGQSVGLSLKKLSKHHQVIAITHLPQIAGLADTHFAVEKTEANKKTSTRLRLLENEERIKEVAKLLSGENITEAGLKSAKELMGIKD